MLFSQDKGSVEIHSDLLTVQQAHYVFIKRNSLFSIHWIVVESYKIRFQQFIRRKIIVIYSVMFKWKISFNGSLLKIFLISWITLVKHEYFYEWLWMYRNLCKIKCILCKKFSLSILQFCSSKYLPRNKRKMRNPLRKIENCVWKTKFKENLHINFVEQQQFIVNMRCMKLWFL